MTCFIKGMKGNAQSFHIDMKQTAGDPQKNQRMMFLYVNKKLKNKRKGPRNHDYCRWGIRNKCARVERFVFTCSMKY